MLIGLDSRALAREQVRGIGRYLWCLLEAMRALGGPVRWRLFYDAGSPEPAIPPGCDAQAVPLRCRGDRWRLWEQCALPLSAAAAGVDVLHAPANFAPAIQLTPTVVTLHDTILWDRPGHDGPGRRLLGSVLPAALRRARRIITVSRHSWADIARRFPFTRRKMEVIPHGLDARFLEPVPAEDVAGVRAGLGLDRPYVLYVGGAEPRKRAEWAVRLLADWSEAPGGGELTLAMLGLAGQPGGAIAQLAARLGVAGRLRVLPYVPAQLLPALYAGCRFVVYPTLYEGFGFPALEAQAAGRAVLIGRTSSLAELAGPAAELLDCDDFQAWAAAGRRRLAHPDGTDEAAHEASRWARRFRWSSAARATLELYRQAGAS